MSEEQQKSIFTNLWERRVPQFFASYLGISWAIVQFLNFITNRYNIDNGLVDKFLIFSAVLIPAVLIFIYNHGKKGNDRWTRFEKIFIPLNTIAAIGIAGFISTPTIQAAPVEVTISGDDGEEITRLVPSKSQARKLYFFPFEPSDERLSWTRTGLPSLFILDLEQDMRITTRHPLSSDYHLKQHDYNYRDKVPFSVMLDIAKKSNTDFFVTGKISKEADDWNLDLKMFDSDDGDVFFEQQFSGLEYFAIIDEASAAIRSQLFLRDADENFGSYTDLPASDLISNNTEALDAYMGVIEKVTIDDKYPEAIAQLQTALALDDKSAEIKSLAADVIRITGDMDSAKKYISEALSLSKQLPERQQFAIKKDYWLYNSETGKAISLMEDYTKLYPRDAEPYEDLAGFYQLSYQLGKAKSTIQRAISNGHDGRMYAKLADICIAMNELDSAEMNLKTYFEQYPEAEKDDKRILEIYKKKGEYDKIITHNEKQLISDPENNQIYLKLAETYYAMADFDKGDANFDKALSFAKLKEDTSYVYQQQLMALGAIGDTDKFEETLDKWHNSLRKHMPEVGIASSTFMLIGIGSYAGASGKLYDFYEGVKKQNPQMQSIIDCVYIISDGMFSNAGKQTLIDYYQGECKNLILASTPDQDYLISGFIESHKGNHEKALESFSTFLEKSGSAATDFSYLLAREQRLLDRPKEAIELCKTHLVSQPNAGNHLLEKGLSEVAISDMDAAKKSYNTLSKVWSRIDERFPAYADFKTLEEAVR